MNDTKFSAGRILVATLLISLGAGSVYAADEEAKGVEPMPPPRPKTGIPLPEKGKRPPPPQIKQLPRGEGDVVSPPVPPEELKGDSKGKGKEGAGAMPTTPPQAPLPEEEKLPPSPEPSESPDDDDEV